MSSFERTTVEMIVREVYAESGAQVYQLTSCPAINSNIYGEVPYMDASSRYLMFTRRHDSVGPSSLWRADLERRLTDAARSRPGRMAVRVDVDERLAHLLQAGADAVLVPSRFEPCGLTQLCGLRYGTLPVVAGVGGLADTVVDATPAARADGTATGFVFAPGSVPGLLDAVRRAVALRARGSDWRRVQHRAMTRDVGWGPSARAYALLYADVVSGARRPVGCGSDGADRGDGTEPAPCPERYRQAPSASSGRDRW